jgi:hypothetical protein
MRGETMKALILNGERNNESALKVVWSVLSSEIASLGWQAESVLLREKKIARCIGCFNCWVKTPGVCVIDDFGREAARMAITSDVLIFMTAVTFGGYSSELKKAIDRFSCTMLLPFFTKIQGEVHHKPRYNPLPRLLGIGVLPGPDEESESIFRALVQRNSVNLHNPVAESAIFYTSDKAESIETRVRSLLKNLKERK